MKPTYEACTRWPSIAIYGERQLYSQKRLVSGVRDKSLSKRLRMKELTLAECVKMVRRSEVTQDQFKRSQMEMANSAEVNKQRYPRSNQARYTGKRSGNNQRQVEMKERECSRCGFSHETSRPAKTANCHKCNKPGHYARRVKTKIDSGVDLSVMSLSTNENMRKPPNLRPTSR